eukprot:Nk52_evm117s221 gene=Nk52_evmTU117s221
MSISPQSFITEDIDKFHRNIRNSEELESNLERQHGEIDELECGSSLDNCKSGNNEPREVHAVVKDTSIDSESECVICCEDLFDECKAAVVECGHEFCLGCILRWFKVKGTCPLCNCTIKHVHCMYDLDGSFRPECVTNLASLMVKARWLDIPEDVSLVEEFLSSSRSRRYDHISVEQDSFGEYFYDDYEEEYDPVNYAPSRGKTGRDRKYEAGGAFFGEAAVAGGSRRRRTSSCGDECSDSVQSGSSKSSSSSVQKGSSQSAPNSHEKKIGRRARRAMKRNAADELMSRVQIGRLSL